MRRGDFARAWQFSDRHLRDRLARGEPQHLLPRHLQSIWDGRPLTGAHVLVRCYHGLGDTVQFIRLARPLRMIARAVSVWCQTELMPLVASAPGVDRVLALHDGAPSLDYDADIEIMELAHALRITAADLPGPVPYLQSPPAASFAGTKRKVGLVWAAGNWNRRRSLKRADIALLCGVGNVAFYSLQGGKARRDIDGLAVEDIATGDITVLAARLKGLDLLITVDTFVAHLAGALGVPVWTLLHSDCDWRWMERGTRSIWYPTMRLFRQRRADDWRPVIAEVAAALTHWQSAPPARSPGTNDQL